MEKTGKEIKMKNLKKALGVNVNHIDSKSVQKELTQDNINSPILNIAHTSVVHILIVPDTKKPEDQSPFQGYLIDLFDEKYISLMHIMSIYPTSANEIYMSNEELISFRNMYSIGNYLILDKSSFTKRMSAFDGFPFIYCYCIGKEEVCLVNEVCKDFKYPPVTVGFEEQNEVILKDEFNAFFLDDSISNRLERAILDATFPDKALEFFKKRKKREKHIQRLEIPSFSHAVTNPNEAVFYGLGFELPNIEKLKSGSNKEVYIDAILATSHALLEITNKEVDVSIKSDLIIYCPSIYTHLYSFKSQFWNQIIRKESKVAKDFIMNGLFKNPNYSGFNIKINDDTQIDKITKSPTVFNIQAARKFELALSSAAINLLSVSNNSPAIRIPNGINFYHSELNDIESLSKSGTDKSKIKLKRKFAQLTTKMRDEIGDRLCDFISQNSSSLTLCTDAILEWLPIDRIPLMFSHEISKINTTPGNKFIQECVNFSSITVSKKHLMNITVIRSFKDNDPLKFILENSINHYAKIDNVVNITFIDVGSSDELIEALSRCKNNILIFDCHGNHGGSESHGWLQIGNEKVDTWKLPVVYPSVIILSACLTSAIGGSHASVANGFLSRGAMSVVGTLLPVDAVDSAVFIGRLIYRISGYLNALSKLNVGLISWRQFLSGLLRLSFCTEFLIMLRDDKKLFDQAKYEKIHTDCNMIINTHLNGWYDMVLSVIHNETGVDMNEIDKMVQNIGLTETMFYSQLGRPETIVIDLTI
ncbi:hypothetical protein [Aliivibrio sp. S2MY1]|uniref:hypothetical protein n=3 Tax=unclassified Aliivibrio TaxID=2645654 RepID=UPI002378B826|nr:hypothetical protein [Aliivibrio sp. S2MY1]MDD9199991.1 hypothetical protein [Aliivibrio sp. S2MY1]